MLAQELYSTLEEGKKLIVVFAPTGFGKTMSSPFLLSLARKDGLASRLIHIVPTRALLRQIYKEKFMKICQGLDIEVAYQSFDRIPSGSKSPYFLADLVVTTLESFLLNAYKLPPSEITKVLEGVSEGHYYPSFAAIATSIVVMDEAHMYLGDSNVEKPEVLVASALAALCRINVPVILESATISTSLLNDIVEKVNLRKGDVEVIYVCPDESESKCPQVRRLRGLGFNVRLLQVGSLRSPTWVTRIVRNLSEAIEEASRLCRERLVLLVLNSVDRAIEVYRVLKNFCDSALIHSRLTENDKEIALDLRVSNLRDSGKGAIVASPVIEVGVEVDADVLITEPAPLENLVQRAGRLCRGSRKCSEAMVLVVGDPSLRGPYNESLISLAINELSHVGRIEWRLLWNSASGYTYVDTLENIALKYPDTYSVSVSKIFEGIIERDARPLDVVWDFLVGEFRSFTLTKMLVGRSKDIEYLEKGNYLIIDLPSLKKFEGKCLDRIEHLGSMKLVLAVVVKTSDRIEVRECTSEALLKALHYGKISLSYVRYLRKELRKCLNDGEYVIDYFVIARPECYEWGVGLHAA